MTTKKKKDAAGVPIVNVAQAIQERAKRIGPPAKTIELRATQTGYYGVRGLADIRKPDDVFPFAVKDLEPAGSHKGREQVSIDGVAYDLPSWAVLASAPRRPADDDEDEDEYDENPPVASARHDDVI